MCYPHTESEAMRRTGNGMMATTTSVSSLLGFVLFVSVGILPSISNPTTDHEVTLWKQGKTRETFFFVENFLVAQIGIKGG